MSEIVYINGKFEDKENAKISPNDRGFLFADGIYEVTKYYKGKSFRFNDHIERLERSLAELSIHYSDIHSLKEIFENLLTRNKLENEHAGIYLQITRGEHKRIHHFPKNITPTVYAYAFQLPSMQEKLDKGIKVITHEDIRWQRCDIKSVSLLPNTMLFNKAVEAGAGECVLIRGDYITEATHSSVFGIKDGVVLTRPLSNLILPGITRKVVAEICRTYNVPLEESAFTKHEFLNMDEAFIAGTGSEITPIVQVDDQPLGKKKPGEITRFIQNKFFELVY